MIRPLRTAHPLARRTRAHLGSLSLAPLAAVVLLSMTAPCLGHGGVYVRPAPLGPMTGVDPKDAERFTAGTTPIGAFSGTGGTLARRGSIDGLEQTAFQRFWRAQGAGIQHEFDATFGDREDDAGATRGRGSAARLLAVGWEPVQEAFAAAMASNDTDIVDSAILAQARCATRETAAAALSSAWPLIAHPSESVRRSALLALGLVPDPQASPILRSFLHNPGRTDPVTNALAAISMGLRSDPETLPDLIRALQHKQAHPEVRAAAVIGLGLFQADRRAAVAALRDALSDPTLPNEARLRVPIAIARHGDAAAALTDDLRALLRDADPSWEVPCATALGRLADPEDTAVRAALLTLARHARDRETRGHAWLALGRIAARQPQRPVLPPVPLQDPTPDAPTQDRARSWLASALLAAGSPALRVEAPFIILAAATAVSGHREDVDRGRVVARLHVIADSKLPADRRGAALLGLGLLRDGESIGRLLEAVRSEDPILANRAATAIGSLGDELGSAAMLARMRDRTLDPRSREIAAAALARLEPDRITAFLTRIADDAITITERVLACRMIGEHADLGAIPLLVRLAKDKEEPSFTRAFAIVGLGRMLERSEIPWNQPVAIDADLRVMTGAEVAVLDIF